MNIGLNTFLPNMMNGQIGRMAGGGQMMPNLTGQMSQMMGMGGGQDQLMSSMMLMAMGQMMTVMGQMTSQNVGGISMGRGSADFGGMGGPQMAGNPIGSFLGGGPNSADANRFFPALANMGDSAPPAGNGTGGVNSPESPSPMGPAGKVGNIDIGKLVGALPVSQRKAAEKHFPYIVAEAQNQGVTNKAQLAYILATATHESGAGAHMEEFASGKAYEGRKTLGNTQAGDGVKYKGRGYVQLTGRRNYADWSKRLGEDLVNNPNRVKDPTVAAKILVGGMKQGTFTGKKLDSYINGQHTDFSGARKIVNGTDHAAKIGETAKRLLAAMN